MKYTPAELLKLLINGRSMKPNERIRFTRKQYNWLENVCFQYGEQRGGLIIWEGTPGAKRAGYANEARKLQIELDGERYICRREFNGSGHVEYMPRAEES